MSRSVRSTALRLAVLGYVLLSLVASQGFREDELQCEEALVHLNECCSELDITDIGCYFSSSGCEGPVTRPLISVEAAHCLKGKSCQYIRDEQICERVEAAHEERAQNEFSGTDKPSAQGLCP